MTDIFIQIINMSISASWLMLVVLLMRLLLIRAPKKLTVLLWAFVGIRLLCPVIIESPFSLIPSAQTVSPDIVTDSNPQIESGSMIINSVFNHMISKYFTPHMGASVNPLQIWISALEIIWIVGMLALIIYTVVRYVKLHSKLKTAVFLKDNVYQCEGVTSAFVFGVIKPKVYVPFGISPQNMEMVIAHEKAHIKRKDYLWKLVAFCLCILHWFSPLLWFCYFKFCEDLELACDEEVIKSFDRNRRADYSQALLTCSIKKKGIYGCPIAFGEVSVEKRVKSVLGYKRPKTVVVCIAVLSCCLVAFCFLTNPLSVFGMGIRVSYDIDRYTKLQSTYDFLPAVDELGNYDDLYFHHLHKRSYLIFKSDAYVLRVSYSDSTEYTKHKNRIEETYVFASPFTDEFGYEVSETYGDSSSGFAFRMLSDDAYGLWYPKKMVFIGVSDDRRELAFVFFEDTDLDYIDDPIGKFLSEECGWEYNY